MGSVKQHVGLSTYARDVLAEDRNRFSMIGEKISKDKLYNTVIINAYRSGMPMTVLDSKFRRFIELYRKHSSESYQTDKVMKALYDSAFELIKEDMEKFASFQKNAEHPVFNIIDEAMEKLWAEKDSSIIRRIFETAGRSSDDPQEWVWGKYVSFILETYARLPYTARTRIICWDTYEAIENAIKGKKDRNKIVRIMHRNHEIYDFVPFEIVPDQMGTYLYVTGRVIKCISVDTTRLKEVPYDCSFRLERISILTTSVTDSLNELTKDELTQMIRSRKVGYLLDEETMSVRFSLTSMGINMMNSILQNRPDDIVPVSGTVNEFSCTATHRQIFSYITRFGPQVRVLEPESLRKEIAEYFRQSMEANLD